VEKLIIVGVVVFVLYLIIKAVSGGPGALEKNGIRGRALVLQSSQTTTEVMMGMRRYESRQMVLDIEIPGRAPYQLQGTFLIPRLLVEACPGSSLEVAVDKKNPNRIAVLGPGGFTGPWLRIGQPPNAY
jgi:hypothetical protein